MEVPVTLRMSWLFSMPSWCQQSRTPSTQPYPIPSSRLEKRQKPRVLGMAEGVVVRLPLSSKDCRERVRWGAGRAGHLPAPPPQRLINAISLTVPWRLRIKVWLFLTNSRQEWRC